MGVVPTGGVYSRRRQKYANENAAADKNYDWRLATFLFPETPPTYTKVFFQNLSNIFLEQAVPDFGYLHPT